MDSAKDRGYRGKKNETTPNATPTAPDQEDPQRLLDRLAQGDRSAFWLIWERHKSYLHRLCARQMNNNPADTEDALSRAMILAWEKLPIHAAKITNLKAWLARLTRNLCIDIHKERQRWNRFSDGGDDVESVALERFMPGYAQPESGCLDDELLELFHDAAEGLPERLRDAFILRCWEDEPYTDIAGQLRITNANVRKRVQQARVLMGDSMGRYLER